jgi:hypothetical protein
MIASAPRSQEEVRDGGRIVAPPGTNARRAANQTDRRWQQCAATSDPVPGGVLQRVWIVGTDRRLATTKARRKIPAKKTTGVGPDPGTSVVDSVAVGGMVDPPVGRVVGPEEDVGAVVEHVDAAMVSRIKVTVPFRASARPFTCTPSAIVMDVRARIVPTNVEPEPSVAELVTCQKTLQGWAPLMKLTELDEAVTRSDVAWKIQTELGSF